jgi:hypothetical protein
VAPATIADLGERVRPVSLAREHLLPVVDALAPLVPGGALARGSVVRVEGQAATSLAVALVAAASGSGPWVAAVGVTGMGLAAAESLGLVLERVVLVDPWRGRPGRDLAEVVGIALEGFDVVLVGGPKGRMSAGQARRLRARVRERRAVLVQVGWPEGAWPDAPDLEARVAWARWEGLGAGWGHARARRVGVAVSGRRGADRARKGWLWLPGPGGGIAVAEPPRPLPVVPFAPPLAGAG